MLKCHPQCRGCQHLQRRGGTVSAPELVCVAAGEKHELRSVVGRMLQVFASEERCPEFLPYEKHPDTYPSEDLLPAEHLMEASS